MMSCSGSEMIDALLINSVDVWKFKIFYRLDLLMVVRKKYLITVLCYF